MLEREAEIRGAITTPILDAERYGARIIAACGVIITLGKSSDAAVMLSRLSDRMPWVDVGANQMTISTDGNLLAREIQSGVCKGDNIRAVIADQLGIEVNRVTDQTHFARDLGVDWLNRLELVMLVEDWTGLELHDDDVEQINVVGDFIRLFESAESKTNA